MLAPTHPALPKLTRALEGCERSSAHALAPAAASPGADASAADDCAPTRTVLLADATWEHYAALLVQRVGEGVVQHTGMLVVLPQEAERVSQSPGPGIEEARIASLASTNSPARAVEAQDHAMAQDSISPEPMERTPPAMLRPHRARAGARRSRRAAEAAGVGEGRDAGGAGEAQPTSEFSARIKCVGCALRMVVRVTHGIALLPTAVIAIVVAATFLLVLPRLPLLRSELLETYELDALGPAASPDPGAQATYSTLVEAAAPQQQLEDEEERQCARRVRGMQRRSLEEFLRRHGLAPATHGTGAMLSLRKVAQAAIEWLHDELAAQCEAAAELQARRADAEAFAERRAVVEHAQALGRALLALEGAAGMLRGALLTAAGAAELTEREGEAAAPAQAEQRPQRPAAAKSGRPSRQTAAATRPAKRARTTRASNAGEAAAGVAAADAVSTDPAPVAKWFTLPLVTLAADGSTFVTPWGSVHSSDEEDEEDAGESGAAAAAENSDDMDGSDNEMDSSALLDTASTAPARPFLASIAPTLLPSHEVMAPALGVPSRSDSAWLRPSARPKRKRPAPAAIVNAEDAWGAELSHCPADRAVTVAELALSKAMEDLTPEIEQQRLLGA